MVGADEFVKHRKAFRETFGEDLRMFWHSALGFDAVSFDVLIVDSRERCCIDVITERWGRAAAAMIAELAAA